MTLVNPKPLGWAFGELLTSAQMNSFGTQIIRALDGTGGGSYTLASPLIIGGSSVQITNLTASVANVTSLSVTAAAVFALDVNVTGDVFADDIVTVDDITAGGDITVAGVATLNGNVTLGNAIADTVTLNAILAMGSGHVRRRISAGADADGTYGPKDWDVVRRGASLAANRSYTIDDTNAANGDEIEFALWSGPTTITVRDPAAAAIQVLDTGGAYDWIRCARVAGTWVAIARGKN